MAQNWKPYLYRKGKDAALDREFAASEAYGMVRLGQSHLFWRDGLRRYTVSLETVSRIFRRVESFDGKLCCGAMTFHIQRLVLIPADGSPEIDALVGENAAGEARALLEELKRAHPAIAYGKPED